MSITVCDVWWLLAAKSEIKTSNINISARDEGRRTTAGPEFIFPEPWAPPVSVFTI